MDSRVVVVSGSSKGTVVRMNGNRLSIGRDPANDLCLRDRAVSRRHFTISETDAAFQLIDLDSHNGTFVNGIPVRRKVLTHGDTIRVGDPLFDIVDPLTDETTTISSKTEGIFYMRRAIRFVTAGAPLGRVTGTRAVRTGVLLGA